MIENGYPYGMATPTAIIQLEALLQGITRSNARIQILKEGL